MKRKKQSIALITLLGLIIICVIKSGFNLKYMMAEVVFSSINSVDSEIIFSQKAGFYENDFYLRIYAPSDEIYYTLDGSEPNRDSYKYEGPLLVYDATQNENTNSMRTDVSGNFLKGDTRYRTPEYLIDKCTILKVAYYDNQGRRSKTEERVYFVNYANKCGYENVNIISITAEPEDLFGKDRGIYVLGDTFDNYAATVDLSETYDYAWEANYKNSGREWERNAYIQVFDTEKELVLAQSVGLRIQGGVSRSFYPKSLNIYARNEYGNNQMTYDFFGTGYYPQRVTLSTGGNDYYGKMKDRLGAELSKNLNFCTMHYEPYVLFLNGEYWGFYYLTEKYDEKYIEHYYDIDKENVIIFKQGGLEAGSEDDFGLYEEMKFFVELADMTINENYQKACDILDMDSFMDYYAAEIYMARNGDWPSANYALWRSRDITEKTYEDGKWRWMLFDVNTSSLKDDLAEHDTLAYVIKECKMFSNLSKNAQFRKSFSDRLREMRDIVFEESLVNEKLDEYKSLMTDPMENYFQRFHGSSNDEFHNRRRKMREFAALRTAYVEIMLQNNGFD